MPKWRLRAATDGDREFLFDLHRTAMGGYIDAAFGWDDGAQQALFDESFDPDVYGVIQVDGEDAGVLVLKPSDTEIWLELIEILPQHRGKGLGTSVVESVLAQATATNKSVGLRVLQVNSSARSLYERLGFVVEREDDVRIYLRADPSG
jgi:GNAT superfamily N-acetyltransferase